MSLVDSQLQNTPNGTGRDHNAYGFTMWMAGGGIKGGVSVAPPTNLARLQWKTTSRQKFARHDPASNGFRPNRLSYFYSGLDQKLVGVEHNNPIQEIIA